SWRYRAVKVYDFLRAVLIVRAHGCFPELSVVISYMLKQHLVDVTEIFNSLNREKNQRYYKLAYLVILLFISLFW
ncbi:hypothetical protein Goarm_022028, partial [Gossypium armourianum]|nr:hypothetical protein [Gossypium armourianum]